MYLQYKTITIRNAVPEDAPLLVNWWNDGRVMAHAGFPNGLGTTVGKVAADIATDSENTRQRLILLCSKIPIGEMCYYHHNQSTAEIGIKICENVYQEKGIGRVALSLLIRFLFSKGYQKIILDTNLKNTRAQHVYELLGFRKVRINIDSWKNQIGESESSVDYELTIDNFQDFTV